MILFANSGMKAAFACASARISAKCLSQKSHKGREVAIPPALLKPTHANACEFASKLVCKVKSNNYHTS